METFALFFILVCAVACLGCAVARVDRFMAVLLSLALLLLLAAKFGLLQGV